MAIRTLAVNAPVTGLIARYLGAPGGSTTRYYWIQAIYPTGMSPLKSVTITAQATMDNNNQVFVSWNVMPGAIGYNIYYTTSATAPQYGAIILALGWQTNGFIDNGASNAPQTGYVYQRGLYEARAIYNFAVDGGAQATITLAESEIIPAGAFVIDGNIMTKTAHVGATSTQAWGIAGTSTTGILGATAVASYAANAVQVAACRATPFRVTADGQITMTNATANLTAGLSEVVIYYVMPSNI